MIEKIVPTVMLFGCREPKIEEDQAHENDEDRTVMRSSDREHSTSCVYSRDGHRRDFEQSEQIFAYGQQNRHQNQHQCRAEELSECQ